MSTTTTPTDTAANPGTDNGRPMWQAILWTTGTNIGQAWLSLGLAIVVAVALPMAGVPGLGMLFALLLTGASAAFWFRYVSNVGIAPTNGVHHIGQCANKGLVLPLLVWCAGYACYIASVIG